MEDTWCKYFILYERTDDDGTMENNAILYVPCKINSMENLGRVEEHIRVQLGVQRVMIKNFIEVESTWGA